MRCKVCNEQIDVNYGATPEQAPYIHIEDRGHDYDHDAEPANEPLTTNSDPS